MRRRTPKTTMSKFIADGRYMRHVATLELSTHAEKRLVMLGIEVMGDLAQKREWELSAPKFGQKTVQEITEAAKSVGISFGLLITDKPDQDKYRSMVTEYMVSDSSIEGWNSRKVRYLRELDLAEVRSEATKRARDAKRAAAPKRKVGLDLIQ